MVSNFPTYEARADYIELMLENDGTGSVSTQPHLDAWIRALRLPYTSAIDGGTANDIQRRLAGKDNTFIVEVATMKILYSTRPEDVAGKLALLP